MRRLPPLNALRAFDAAARHESFSRAGEELSVTHGAISRQVDLLERRLGARLFTRSARGLALTPAGRLYRTQIAEALDRIAAASASVSAGAQTLKLDISAPPTFTIKWLVPRLAAFHNGHPAVEIRLNTKKDAVSTALSGAEVVIRRGPQAWPGLHSTEFLQEAVTPVSHPSVAAQYALRSPADLQQMVWLHADARPNDWPAWLQVAGVPDICGRGCLRFDHSALALEAAMDGIGVAMAPLSMIRHDLDSGALCTLWPGTVASTQGYYAICARDFEEDGAVAHFCSWLTAAGAESHAPARKAAPGL